MIIEFIGGPLDGQIRELDTQADYIHFPMFPKFNPYLVTGDEVLPLEDVTYKRISDTHSYICISQPKEESHE